MRLPFGLGRRSQEPARSAGGSGSGPIPRFVESAPGDEPAALEALPHVLGPAPATLRPDEFIAGLAVSRGLTPTLRTLERGHGPDGPSGLIGGLALPLAASAGPPTMRAGARGGAGRSAAGPDTGGLLVATIVGATDRTAGGAGAQPAPVSGFGGDAETASGPVRRLPVVDPALAERRRSLTSVDPASYPWPAAGAGHATGGGPAAAVAVSGVESTAESAAPGPEAALRPGFASGPLRSGLRRPSPEAGASVAGPASPEAHAAGPYPAGIGSARRYGLGAPMAALPASAVPRGFGAGRGPGEVGPLAGGRTRFVAAPEPAAPSGSAAASRPVTVAPASALPLLPLASAGASAAEHPAGPGSESDAAAERTARPSGRPPRTGARVGESSPTMPSAGGAAGAAGSGPAASRPIAVHRLAIGHPAEAPARSSSPAGASTAGPGGRPRSGSDWVTGPGALPAGGRGLTPAYPTDLGPAAPERLPLAAPAGVAGWASQSAQAVSAFEAEPLIQRLYAPAPSAGPTLVGPGPEPVDRSEIVVARQPAGGGGGGGAAAGAAAPGGGSMPDDQVELLARRVYSRIRDRLGAELLRDRERAGLLPDR